MLRLSSGTECRGQASSRGAERGQHAGQPTRRERRKKRKAQNPHVEPDVVEPWKLLGSPGRNGADQHPAEHHAKHPTKETDGQAFRQELSRQPAPPRAERRTDRELAASRHATRQQQVRHVCAGDEQNQPDCGHQYQHRRTNAPGHFLRESPHAHFNRPALPEEKLGGHRPRHTSRG